MSPFEMSDEDRFRISKGATLMKFATSEVATRVTM